MNISKVTHAYNGKEAMNFIHEETPDIILLDIVMPLMDGIQLLQEVNQADLNPRIIIISAYNEFEYAKEAMKFGVKDYILKPIDSQKLGLLLKKLFLEISNENTLWAEKALNSILNKKIDKDSTKELIDNLFKKFSISKYQTTLLTCKKANPRNTINELLVYIKKSVNPGLIMSQPDSNELFVIIPIFEYQTSENACQSFLDVINQFKMNLVNVDFTIGFSEVSEEPYRLSDLYNQSKTAEKMSFYDLSGKFVYSDKMFLHELDRQKMDIIENDILDSIRLAFYELKCIDLIESFFSYFRHRKVYPDIVYNSCYNLILHVNRKLKNEYPDNGNLFIDLSMDSVKECTHINDLEMIFAKNYFNMLKIINSFRPKSDLDIVKEIKVYIDKNYFQNLSLDIVSDKFFISKYQLSRVFKKEVGINYWDYITQVRMENAKILLINTQLKIFEIAEKTGYDDTSHFSTTFKKYHGKSPKALR